METPSQEKNVDTADTSRRAWFEVQNLIKMLSQRTGRKKSKRNGGFPKKPTTSPRKERNRKTRKDFHCKTSNKRRNVLI
jgi:hypothetical protein